jgi:hypothetical protein
MVRHGDADFTVHIAERGQWCGACDTKQEAISDELIRRMVRNGQGWGGTGAILMEKVIQGTVHGRTIELSEDPGLADGQRVEVRVKETPITTSPPMSEGLAKVYAILGERYASGVTDTAARHDEHQP